MTTLEKFWKKLEGPVLELTAHFCVSILTGAFIAISEEVLVLLHLDKKNVPIFDVPLADWMFGLEIFSMTAIILVGCAKASREMWK